jgi:hypothetical protein
VEAGRKRNIDFLRLEKKVPFFLECRYRLWDKLVLSKIRKAIGVENGNIFPTAGAPLSDTINEFLSLMAPPKAPYLLSIDSSQSGSTGKLSFDSTHQIPGYSYNNNLINSVVSKNAYCLGIFNGSTTISGTLNSAVSADPSSAWPANSFGPGNEGTLVLRVNGVILHTVDLTTFTSGNSTTGGSGFSLSASTPAQFSNGNKFTPIQYRTGSIIISAAAQRPGYNVVIVEHVSSDTSTTTNEFYWFKW